MTLRVGLVAEGPSDWLVLEAVLRQFHPEVSFVRLQPDRTLAMQRGQGWRGVRAWCNEFGPQLEAFLTGLAGDPLDLLVIHADCAIADKLGAERPCPPADATAAALAEVIDRDWLGRVPRPPVVLALPAMTIDTWVVATLDPPVVDLTAIECDRAAEDWLGRDRWGDIKRLRTQDGELKKSARAYAPFAERVGIDPSLVRQRCPRADRFCHDIATAISLAHP